MRPAATSRRSPRTVVPSTSVNVIPDASCRAAVTSWPRCTSQRSHASRVKRSATVSSWLRSSSPLRPIIDTLAPNAENTCANSAAMYPLPTITSRSGTSSMRMIVSDVWCGTSRSGSGIHGRPPVAITMRSAVNSACPPGISTVICFGPVNRAWPSYRVTFALRCAR